ncbi:MAG TPA: hypothetical protein VKA94_05945 [Hyphomicrobiales bacterium]|nr:hypothetical protein [Hyphomicrobiales bacterium]
MKNAPPVLDEMGGTQYVLYRRDRVICRKGAELLKDYRLTATSPTRRVVAECCNSAMFLEFEKGHWFSMYKARFGSHAPKITMRVQWRDRVGANHDEHGVPVYKSVPPRFVLKLIASRIAMFFKKKGTRKRKKKGTEELSVSNE